MATITIKGVDKLLSKLQSLEKVQDVLTPPMRRATMRIEREMAMYPPRRPGSTYIRTNRLSQGWTTKPPQRTAGGLVGKVGNNTSYAPWVQSKRFQAGIHRGRWHTEEDVLERNRGDIVRDFERAIQRELEK